jgi:hypothetical protein
MTSIVNQIQTSITSEAELT